MALTTKYALHPSEKPQKTFFYERPDGTVFACNEKEAASAHKRFKQVGVSDGELYFSLMRKAIEEQNTALEKLEREYPKEKKPKKYFTKRMDIMDATKTKIHEAALAEQQAAMGHIEKPHVSDLCLKKGNFSPQMEQSLGSFFLK